MLYSVKKYQKVSNVFKKRKRFGFMALFQFFYSSPLSNLNVAISDKKTERTHIQAACAEELKKGAAL